MKQRDKGWDLLADAITDALRINERDKRSPSGAVELADRLGSDVTPEDVRNWLRYKSNPRFDLIPQIAQALDIGVDVHGVWDPLALPGAMGVLPKETPIPAPELAIAVHKLQGRMLRLQETIAVAGANLGAASIAQRACELERWAVAVWPAVTGPPTCRLHVADRLDFRRTDDVLASEADLWRDFGDVFRGSGAIPARSSPRWAEGPDPSVLSWAIPRVGAPRASTALRPWPKVPSIMVTSVTVQAWGNDVASHLADGLGYGLLSTRDLSMDLYGLRTGPEAAEVRDDLHRWLVDSPPPKRVWSHWSPLQPITGGASEIRQGVVGIWLHEDDALLEVEASRAVCGFSLKELKNARAAQDEVARVTDGIWRLDVRKPRSEFVHTRRQSQFMQCLERTVDILELMFDNGQLNPRTLTAGWNDVTRNRSEASTKQVSSAAPSQRAVVVQGWLRAELHRRGRV